VSEEYPTSHLNDTTDATIPAETERVPNAVKFQAFSAYRYLVGALEDSLQAARRQVLELEYAIPEAKRNIRRTECGICAGEMLDVSTLVNAAQIVGGFNYLANLAPTGFECQSCQCFITGDVPTSKYSTSNGPRSAGAKLMIQFPQIEEVRFMDGAWYFRLLGNVWYALARRDGSYITAEALLEHFGLYNPRIPRQIKPGFVYAIESGDFIKVGYSSDPAVRLKELQTSSPIRLTLLATRPGTVEDERNLHVRFAEYRAEGEWFHALPVLREALLPWFRRSE